MRTVSILQRRVARPLGSLCLILCVTWHAHAAAQSADSSSEPPPSAASGSADAEIAAEFERGLKAEHDGELSRARDHYERALSRAEALSEPSPRARALLALGYIHYKLQAPLLSVTYLKRALADPTLKTEPAQYARRTIHEQMKQLGHLEIRVKPPLGDTAEVEVEVDGQNVPDPSDVPVAVGRHEVRATASGYRELVKAVDVGAGESKEVAEILVREQAMSSTRRAAWIVAGVSAVPLAVGIGAGIYAWVKGDQSECNGPCTIENERGRNDARTAGFIADGTWAAAGVGAAVSAYLFWRSANEDSLDKAAAKTRVTASLTSVTVTHRW